ncbi:hypothetical protein M231_02154 [Tremella mesenterica]|uniref:Uncharacterized protein n=1 Tax=Tremella mesenterica TaxID=5217 RepID=A0A4Q1BRI3_TREME|nr:hypothetical protein M231_02154 [Tremella mesenterica]
MPRPKGQPLSLQEELTTARNELELATLLNKGVLHSLQENKITIEELRRENAVLRAAESQLARTEDALADAEQRVEELEDKLKSVSEEVERVREARAVVDRERQMWREKLERWEKLCEGFRDIMDAKVSSGPGPYTVHQQRVTSNPMRSGSPFRQPSGGRKKRRIDATPSSEDLPMRTSDQQSSSTPPPKPNRPLSSSSKKPTARQGNTTHNSHGREYEDDPDNRESRIVGIRRHNKEPEVRDHQDWKEARDVRQAKSSREVKDVREELHNKESRYDKDGKDLQKNNEGRENRDGFDRRKDKEKEKDKEREKGKERERERPVNNFQTPKDRSRPKPVKERKTSGQTPVTVKVEPTDEVSLVVMRRAVSIDSEEDPLAML